jgi:copper homeostasis protein
MHKLEVIVTSADEAIAAQKGGADRLELVRDLTSGGLTPAWETARAVMESVSIPVRVMLRENASMLVANAAESVALREAAARLRDLPIDGLVLGWIDSAADVDLASLGSVLNEAPMCKVTFHRAFEHLRDPFAGLKLLKGFPQVDKILTCGGTGSWPERKNRLKSWRVAAAPEIGILVGGGLSEMEVAELMADADFPEVHVGRAARTPAENDGAIDPAKIALLKTRRGG